MSWTYASISDQALIKQFEKDTRMLMHSAAPTNLETPLAMLADAITPHERFFMRNNAVIPMIAPAEWRLTIDGMVERPYTLTYAELRGLPATRLLAFLECYGNGRQRFAEQGQPAEGLPWRDGAIGNTEWIGVPVAQ